MTQEPQAQPNRLEWEDVEDVARQLFHVWVDGQDLAWAKKAWHALSEAGMTSYTSDKERVICVARLIALNALYREFCVRAFDEGSTGEWADEIPLLDDDTMDQFAVLDGVAESESDPEVISALIQDLVRAVYKGVVKALIDRWGKDELFASLYVTGKHYEEDGNDDQAGESEAPVTAAQIDRVMNSDVTAGAGRAYDWFTDGMGL